MFTALKALPRTVWLVGAISFLNDGASDLLYPLIPLYLSAVLMAGPRALGLIEGIAEATASLLKLFSGVLMDRTRRARPWMLLGYGLAGLGRPLIAFISSWPWLLVIRFSDRVGKGLRSAPRDALLAGSVDCIARWTTPAPWSAHSWPRRCWQQRCRCGRSSCGPPFRQCCACC
jgi:MFS family permease